ncbi:PadR family transcriptional regulator [Nocardioides sp. InS609-2]|uniref:PadR family transcriptional regulator n=1 Tax=Nocardioides sp. InS609-2 TaxID=2760705 RepID=UPI001828BB9C|nr:PadR family transcriptional regulator [Nocardioides sp. InS609-2]MBA3782916.1 PadR family transcriptional regulator [Nocardioides sp.]
MPRQDLPITSYALLGLLTFGDELTGYELKQRADMTLRFYWVSPAMSQVYSELARLTEAGLVHKLGEGRGTTYRITAHGRRDLAAWMRETPAGFQVLKHPVALRLLLGHLVDTDDTLAMLRSHLTALEEELSALREVRESLRGADHDGEVFRHPALVADWGLDYLGAEREIVARLVKRVEAGE